MESADARRDRKLVSDSDRDKALDKLATAVAEGRLTMEEYDQRTTSALVARTVRDVDAVTDDLPGDEPPPAAPPARPEDDQLTAILGNETRKGPWIVPGHLSATSVLGDCHIEMREARLQQQVTTIDAKAVLGSISILVPDSVEVRLTGWAVLGSKTVKLRRRRPFRPGAPILEVRCQVLLGSVSVRRKR